METAIFVFFVLLLSFLFAKVEIAIEGPHGWAENLPTWKLPAKHWFSKIFFGGRPATGYHVWMNLFTISFLHTVYIYQTFSWNIELKLFAFLILFWTIEDFLWFVLNPAFGIKKFKKEYIWWHRHGWILFAPRDYFIAVPVGIALYILSKNI